MANYEKMINQNEVCLIPEPVHMETDSQGRLFFCRQNTEKLAEKYGTPLLLYNEGKLRANYRKMEESFRKHYDKIGICFAYKSNSLVSIFRIFQEEGAYADVVSEGEFFLAETAGMDPAKIIFNGNNKLQGELELGLSKGALFNVDSLDELFDLLKTAEGLGRRARVCIRVNPGVNTGIIPEFSTALKKSKFGIDMDNGEAFRAFQIAAASPHCLVEGIHTHIGSQIEESKFYRFSTARVMDFCGQLKRELGLDMNYVNLGGGFAIPFEYLDKVDPIEQFAEIIAEILKEKVALYHMKEPTVLVEPGGSLVGDTAILLLTVGRIKEREGKKLAAIDGGGDVLLRATQGWYTYRVVCAGKMKAEKKEFYDLVGPLCYEGDIPAHNRFLPVLEKGDIIAFLDVGAYTTSLFNRYNGRKLPTVLMLHPDRESVRVIRRRDENVDLLQNQEPLA